MGFSEVGAKYSQGRWSKDEHYRFLEALKLYGKEWRRVQQHVETRTSTQARSHAQKFFVKLEKRRLTLDEFLEKLDLDRLKQLILDSDCEDYEEPQCALGEQSGEDQASQKSEAFDRKKPKNVKKKSVMNLAIPEEEPRKS